MSDTLRPVTDRSAGRAAWASAIVEQMTIEEAVSVVAGASDWETAPVERLDLASIRLSDGPSGVRGLDWITSTSWNTPCGSALGATWDVELVERVGRLLGRDAADKGVDVHLSPNLNLQRTPVGGRNFESFGEDPVLVASIGVAYVRGVQREGVLSCPKHFVCNDTETERFTVDVRVDERTLREVYLRPFEEVLGRGGALAVMAAYNSVNGTTMSEHTQLLTGVLRDDWGFDGLVVSDWFCVRTTVEALLAGCDLEMPGPSKLRGPLLLDAIERGEVDEPSVRTAARRLVGLVGAATEGVAARAPSGSESTAVTESADRALLADAVAGSMVLVRNGRHTDGQPAVAAPLPIDTTSLRTLCVIGPNARTGQLNGGGSAIVRPRHPSHPLDALRARLSDTVEVRYAQGCSIDRATPLLDPALCGPLTLDLSADPATDWAEAPDRSLVIDTTKLLWFRDPFERPGPPRFAARLRTTFVPDRSGVWTFGIRSVGDAVVMVDGVIVADNAEIPLPEITALGKPEQVWQQELIAGSVHEVEVRLVRTDGDDGLSAALLTAAAPDLDDPIGEAVAAATGADVAVVVVGTNADWESEGRDRADIALPGDQDELVRRVAAAATMTIVVVNAGSPVAMPWIDDVDAVLVAWFPGEAFGEALADVLLGDREPAGRLPITFPRALADTPTASSHPGTDGTSRYDEGRLIGHRWYEVNGVEPLFPFGHGLGYGSVELLGAELVDPHRVRVWLRHAAGRPTRACVQVYAQRVPHDDLPVDEAASRLVGFARHTVEPGAPVTIDVVVDRRAFQQWDVASRSWRPQAGPFELRIGSSSADLPLTVVVGDR